MLKILTVIFCFFVVTRGFDYPGRFEDEVPVSRWQHRHIHNMTENLIKDALYKLRHADVVQLQYKVSSSFQLGMISAGIMDHWRRMISVYRYYSNAKDFKNHVHTITQIMNAYSVIQSDYNEIVHTILLFYQVLEHHKQKQKEERIMAKYLAKKYQMPSKLLLQMMRSGIDVEGTLRSIKIYTLRRMMMPTDLNDTSLDTGSMEDEAFSRKMNGIVKKNEIGGYEDFEFSKKKTVNEWVKKDAKNTEEAEYKKSLRYKTWAKKWDGFNPEIEGVNIPDKIANMGLKNASDFFLTELKEDFI